MADSKVTITIQARDAEKTRQALKKIGVESKVMGTKMQQSSRAVLFLKGAMQALGLTMGGLIILMGIKGMVKTAIEFESAFAGVKKTVDATEAEFKQLSKSLVDMSVEMGIAAKDLAKIQEVAGQLGVRGVEKLTKFTKTIAILGATTNIVGETGSLQLARFLSILGETEDNVDRAGSALVELGNNFRAQEAEILNLGLNLASFGSQIGLSADQVLAFSTAIIGAGGIAQAASTAFQKVALKIKDAVITGNKDLTLFANIAGITSEKFKKAFQEDAANALALFLEGLNRIDKAGGSVTQALAEIGLADVRLVREFGKVIKQTDVLRDALVSSEKGWRENTAATDEFGKRLDTTQKQMDRVREAFNALSIEIGEGYNPALARAASNTADFLVAIREVTPVIIENMTPAIKSISKLFREAFGTETVERIKSIAGVLEETSIQIEDVETKMSGLAEGAMLGITDPEAVEKEEEKIATIEEMWTTTDQAGRERILKRTQFEIGKNAFMIDTFSKGWASVWDMAGKQRDTFTKGMSNAFLTWIKGTGSVKDAFKELGKQMIDILLDWIVQATINEAISKMFKAGQIATAAVTGKAVAAAWAPAAALASLASFGANAAPANAALVGTVGLAKTLAIAAQAGAEGGEDVVSKPTIFLAGESGAERINISPMRRGGAEGGGGRNIFIDIRIDTAVLTTPENMDEFITRLREEIGFIDERELLRTNSL